MRDVKYPLTVVLGNLLLAVGANQVCALAQAADPPGAEALQEKARAVLSRLEGEVVVPGLREPAEVLRDRWGVPHIYARNQDDLFFAQGFVCAQDRLFQMELWRRLTRGETAELLGKERLGGDRLARLLRYRGNLAAEWVSYAPDSRRIATAFTRGINAFIDHCADRLPIEFQILKTRPGKWEPEDVLGRMSGIIMSRNFQQEVARAQLIAAVGLEKARRLAPTDPPRDFAPAPGLDLAGIDAAVLAGYEAATRQLRFQLGSDGSNNWVVGGGRSVSSRPLLASDPHRSITLPSLRYLVHLHAPGWNVIGSGEPALPGVAIGHNERIAWGITIVGTDQADLYVEQTNPANPTEYKVGDRWEAMRIVREQVRVKGEARPRELELRFTRHGPVLHEDAGRHRAFALKWCGSEPGGAAYLGSLAVARAGNRQQFLEALRAWKIPALNFVYADVEGTIGWVAAGLTPVRRGWDGLLPVPGNGGYEWAGFLDVKELPQRFNPPAQYLATANHNILYPGYRHAIAYDWAPDYRIRRIRTQLEGKNRWDLEGFKGIQHDSTSLPGQTLARLIGTMDLQDPALQPYARLLAGWNGVLATDARAGPLYAVWLEELQDAFYRPHVPERLLASVRALGGLPVMLSALEKPERPWFGASPVAGRDRLLRTTFARAVQKVKTRLPGEPTSWTWGRLHTAIFRHPLATLGAPYAQAFNLGPVPRPGDVNTPNNTRHDSTFQQIHGASYRQLFDLADWDHGLATSTPGQSGQPGSPHYGDLLPLWGRGEYFPLVFTRTRVEQEARHRLRLRPQ